MKENWNESNGIRRRQFSWLPDAVSIILYKDAAQFTRIHSLLMLSPTSKTLLLLTSLCIQPGIFLRWW
jgi:hypothetical protein